MKTVNIYLFKVTVFKMVLVLFQVKYNNPGLGLLRCLNVFQKSPLLIEATFI